MAARPYLLLSLWSPQDEATIRAHAFAQLLHQRRAAVAFFDGEAVDWSMIQEAATRHPEAVVVVFSHGGATLSASRSGVGLHPSELAAHLSGRRIYAFACSTFEPQRLLIHSTFAQHAVDACIQVFAGHAAPVMAPLSAHQRSEQMESALCSLILRFVDGEEDEASLRNFGRGFVTADQLFELDLPPEDPEQEGALGWSSGIYLQKFFASLRVRSKASAAEDVRDLD